MRVSTMTGFPLLVSDRPHSTKGTSAARLASHYTRGEARVLLPLSILTPSSPLIPIPSLSPRATSRSKREILFSPFPLCISVTAISTFGSMYLYYQYSVQKGNRVVATKSSVRFLSRRRYKEKTARVPKEHGVFVSGKITHVLK